MGYPGRDGALDAYSVCWGHYWEGVEHQKVIKRRWLYLIRSSINNLGREISRRVLGSRGRKNECYIQNRLITEVKIKHLKRWPAKESPFFKIWLRTSSESLTWLISTGPSTRLWFLKASRQILPVRMIPLRMNLCLTKQKKHTTELDKFGFKLGLHHHRTLDNSALSSNVSFKRQWSCFWSQDVKLVDWLKI